MLKYNGYSITFDDEKESDKLNVQNIKKRYELEKIHLKREYKLIQKGMSELTLQQRRAVTYLYQHLYLYNNVE